MPNTASAKKRLRQNIVRRARNRSARSTVRSQVKNVVKAVADGDVETAEAQYRLAAKKLDRAGARRLLHPNTASRKKSRLQRLIRKAKQAESLAETTP